MIVLLKSTYFVFLLCAKCRFLAKKGAPKGKNMLSFWVLYYLLFPFVLTYHKNKWLFY